MQAYIRDDRFNHYFRRYEVGYRFSTHGARTRTACEWSGLSRNQLLTLKQRWRLGTDERKRGPAPSSLRAFFLPARQNLDATELATFCRMKGAIGDPCVTTGERLCEAYEASTGGISVNTFEFEYSVLIVRGLKDGVIALAKCSCGAARLVDCLKTLPQLCEVCGGSVRR